MILFRGILTPASLKPAGVAGECLDDELFRGILAPASLKHHRHVELLRESGHLFRGILAPASLKHR